jgi:hypothetical protein
VRELDDVSGGVDLLATTHHLGDEMMDPIYKYWSRVPTWDQAKCPLGALAVGATTYALSGGPLNPALSPGVAGLTATGFMQACMDARQAKPQ